MYRVLGVFNIRGWGCLILEEGIIVLLVAVLICGGSVSRHGAGGMEIEPETFNFQPRSLNSKAPHPQTLKP